MGYLVSRYPAISHTFILREVQELRRLGCEIWVFSINGLDRKWEDLAAEEKSEAASTFYVKQAGLSGAILGQAGTLLKHPIGYVKAGCWAVALGGLDLQRSLQHFFYFVEAAMIANWMVKQKLERLHVHFATPAATVAMFVAKLLPIQLSITVHGPDEFYDVTKYLLREKFEASKLVCTISSYARSQIMKLTDPANWKQIALTPLGVDPDIFSPVPFRANYDTFEILCVGRLVPAKGQHILLEAIHRLLSAGRKVRLVLVGDGPDRRSLERAVSQRKMDANVFFAGAVNQDCILGYYKQAHAFALASFAEGVPVVLMEAMAMEIPCISTWIAGIPELIRDSVDGLLVAPSDGEALAESIERLMDESGLRRRLGQAGRLRVVDKYNLKKNVARLGRVFAEGREAA